ncbi:hypothetical protein FYK55_02910 [Roseiconus nitratireducens]|uniref:Flp pilus assembly protein CpaB n=1 Tax=Roseiconus nitratireducens TaxID=2605748 RepID=A0A5M6DER7_9BACT|nr:hypothetical protein FYK55_02910 [Roseiconus nitratireducens]
MLFAGCALTFGIVRAAGWLDQTAPLAQEPSREGMVPVPKSLVRLKAFDVVQREDVYDRTLGSDSYFWLPEAQVADHPEWITRFDEIIGRVMAREKRADFVFSEKDFLPEGSRSGIAGGVPNGKQGFFLDAEKIPGLRFLKSGDRFDLLASNPDEPKDSSSEYGLLMGGIKARGGKPIPLTGVQILAQNAELIALATNRSMTTQGGLDLANTESRGRSVNTTKEERVCIAIDPDEAVALTGALGAGLEINMVTRSGQQSGAEDDADVLAGRIALPANAVPIEAFQSIQAQHLAEPNTGELRQYFFLPGDVENDWIARPEQLIGRVVRRAIEPGYIFRESDFLPPGSLKENVEAYESVLPGQVVEGSTSKWVERVAARDLSAGSELSEADFFPPGTKPGIASAIPSNRMALTINVDDIRGASELSRGDRFDLLASTRPDLRKTMRGVEISPSLATELQSSAVNRVLATEALVIQTSEEQVVVAIRPSEISLVAKALAQETQVFCVARTGTADPNQMANQMVRPSESPETVGVLVSDPDPMSEISITETLIGGRRKVRAYRRSP